MGKCENNDEVWLRHAIALSAGNLDGDKGGPFGAVIVSQGRLIGEGANRVLLDHDPTAHAEMVAIRTASSALGQDHLDGAVLYTSCEPCPMCLAAAYWAGIGRIVWANSRRDAEAIGFGDALIYQEIGKPAAARQIAGQQLLAEEGRAVFTRWKENNPGLTYGPKVVSDQTGTGA